MLISLEKQQWDDFPLEHLLNLAQQMLLNVFSFLFSFCYNCLISATVSLTHIPLQPVENSAGLGQAIAQPWVMEQGNVRGQLGHVWYQVSSFLIFISSLST